MQYGKFRSCCGPRIIDSFFQFDASSSSTSLPQVSLLAESTSRSDCTSIPASGNQFANTSQDSDCERPSKAVSKKQSVYTHFPQDRNFEICKRINITALCRKRTGEAVRRVKKNRWLWYKIWQLNGHNLVRAKPKFSGDGKEFTKVSRPVEKVESHFSDILWNLAKLLTSDLWIVVHLRVTDPNQMVLLKEWYA